MPCRQCMFAFCHTPCSNNIVLNTHTHKTYPLHAQHCQSWGLLYLRWPVEMSLTACSSSGGNPNIPTIQNWHAETQLIGLLGLSRESTSIDLRVSARLVTSTRLATRRGFHPGRPGRRGTQRSAAREGPVDEVVPLLGVESSGCFCKDSTSSWLILAAYLMTRKRDQFMTFHDYSRV